MISEAFIRNQANEIDFVMVNASLTEVPGLGNTFTLMIKKSGSLVFVASAGVKTETSHGWYHYVFTAAECDTIGPVAVKVSAPGCIQQNLEYVVQQRNAGCIDYTYTVINSVTLNPEPDVEVWITTDALGTHVIWNGFTDAAGVARDAFGNLPCVDAGTYYFWKHHVGLIDDDNPDTEIVS